MPSSGSYFLPTESTSSGKKKIRIKKINNYFEISGNFKTNETKINLNNYRKLININLDLIDDRPINLSSENELSFKINKKLNIKDFSIISKLNFDELFTKSKYQDLINIYQNVYDSNKSINKSLVQFTEKYKS